MVAVLSRVSVAYHSWSGQREMETCERERGRRACGLFCMPCRSSRVVCQASPRHDTTATWLLWGAGGCTTAAARRASGCGQCSEQAV
ncbi:hypothetical protein BU26DRAFT_151340 [Trematosphaeria pertusa]|uniref:Uncharacterized protein n=1 Tax=Trematosphaeria pertusa TaxID=390896 RepID=A0A6A6IXQ6_9PLEO|nr:uncharacterized protein BU26DRAFT_151340 [Trematosphaeria pertusa]KAF2255146.1 hypothetical protein BU26DRAFT_151340 [Trematosphaeria pertusa]